MPSLCSKTNILESHWFLGVLATYQSVERLHIWGTGCFLAEHVCCLINQHVLICPACSKTCVFPYIQFLLAFNITHTHTYLTYTPITHPIFHFIDGILTIIDWFALNSSGFTSLPQLLSLQEDFVTWHNGWPGDATISPLWRDMGYFCWFAESTTRTYFKVQ